MNVKLLRKIQKHILEEPRRFAMGAYQSKGESGARLGPVLKRYNADNEYEQEQKFPSCGTICCIAGWAKIFDPKDKLDFDKWGVDLIDAYSWPEKFRSRYATAKTPRARAKIAAERIEYFIKTKGAK